MTSAQLLTDAFGRIRGVVHDVVEGLSAEQLAFRVGGRSNSIAWLVWHLTRIQDDHVAAAAGVEQVWTTGGWCERFGLPLPVRDTGYGHGDGQGDQVRAGGDLLAGYYDAVHDQTVGYVASLGDDDLSRIVDRSWDPPVTLGVRLVSVIEDDLQHGGQAAFVRGLMDSGLD